MIYSGAAGNDLLLAAEDEIRLEVARNIASSRSDNKSSNQSSSGSVGISFSEKGPGSN